MPEKKLADNTSLSLTEYYARCRQFLDDLYSLDLLLWVQAHCSRWERIAFHWLVRQAFGEDIPPAMMEQSGFRTGLHRLRQKLAEKYGIPLVPKKNI